MFYHADYYRIIANEYDSECRAVHDYEHHADKNRQKTENEEKGDRLKGKWRHTSACNWGWKKQNKRPIPPKTHIQIKKEGKRRKEKR